MHQVALLFAVLLPADLHGEFITLMAPLEYRYTGGTYWDVPFKYRLFVPVTRDAADKKPLIVWLHGLGEASDDNLGQLRWLEQLIFWPPLKRERYPFFLLAVQCPKENRDWTLECPAADGDDMINVVAAILQKTLREYPVDPDRVYLSGVSSGGSGCWDMAMRYPEYFAALGPMASRGADNSSITKLRNIPVWAFHSKGDKKPRVELVKGSIDALNNTGGTGHLTEIDSDAHNCWTSTYRDHHLLDWLLSQRRGGASWWNRPGSVPIRVRYRNLINDWQWWQVLVQISFPVLIFVVVRHVRRIRRRKRSLDSPTRDVCEHMSA